MKRALLGVTGAVVIGLGGILIATPAFAENKAISTTDSGGAGGMMSFNAHDGKNDDTAMVWDRQADGWSATGYILDGKKTVYSLTASGESKTPVKRTASSGKKYDLVEGKTYTMKVCLTKKGHQAKNCQDTSVRNWNNE